MGPSCKIPSPTLLLGPMTQLENAHGADGTVNLGPHHPSMHGVLRLVQ